MTFMEERDVRFVRLAFCDIFGQLKNISVSVSALERAFSDGIRFDASEIRGFLNVEESDLLLFPDPSTLSILPWRPSQGKVARFFCDIRHPDHTPFEGDARHVLKEMERKLRKNGIEVSIGSECEFYLFKLDEDGNPTSIPMDNASYFDIAPLDKGENIRRDICLNMEMMGLTFETSHHEKGPGQNEVVFRHSLMLDAADHLITFKSLVKTLAARSGLFASFLPKPLFDQSGSGLHVNISMHTATTPFAELERYMIGGILRRIREITVYLNPIVNSYRRLGAYEAPGFVDWGYGNRGLLIRVPQGASEEERRIEVRSADPSCNPYIAYTLLVSAALEGVRDKIDPDSVKSGMGLPHTLFEAIEEAENSEFVATLLPPPLNTCFLAAKRTDYQMAECAEDPQAKGLEMEFTVT